MAALAFGTLDVSKTLRNAGVDERTAEAIIEVVRRTTEMPDISHLEEAITVIRRDMVTKDDLAGFATKERGGCGSIGDS